MKPTIIKTITLFATTIAFLLLMVTCQKEEVANRDYPRINTLEVTNITASGATFNAEIISGNLQDILEYGFVWDTNTMPVIGNGDQKSIQGSLSGKIMSAEIHSALAKSQKYYVMPYLRTASTLVYGKTVEFISLGSDGPVIRDFFPKTGSWGDTIRIFGKNFRYKMYGNLVKLGGVDLPVITSTDTTIVALIPDVQNSSPVKVSISVVGNSAVSTADFTYDQPQITQVTPLSATYGDTIYIHGTNLVGDKVFFNDLEVPAVYTSAKLFKVLVPFALGVRTATLKVQGPVTDIAFSTPFTLKEMALKSFAPDTIRQPGEHILINGENFFPGIAGNQVQINGWDVVVVNATANRLEVILPDQIIPDPYCSVFTDLDVSISSIGLTVRFAEKLPVSYQSRWTRMKDFPGNPRIYGTSFSINGKGYIGLGSQMMYGEGYKDMWEYNPKNDSWRRLNDFPGEGRSRFVTLVIGSKVYIITGTKDNGLVFSNNLSEVWEFDPASDQWTRKADFPGGERWNAFGFALNNNGYVGGGVYGNYQKKMDFWKYDPVSDHWTQRNDLNEELWEEDIFAIANQQNGYILSNYCGSPCDQRFIWKYHEGIDSWSAERPMPGPFLETTGFLLKDQFYIGTGVFSDWSGTDQFFSYDPAVNQWSSFYFSGGPKRNGSSFAIGDYGYLMLGKSGSHDANLLDVWRFDPSYPKN